jgi:Bacterial trigger factor protein (TF)
MQIAQLEYQLDNSILTQRTLRLRIGETDVRVFCDQEAGKLQEKLSVPGFRRGRAPLILLRKFHWKRIEPRAFAELKRAALEQVFRLLDKADQPLTPPEVLDEAKIRVRYGRPLEFAIKYLVDPSGLTVNPQQPAGVGVGPPPLQAPCASRPLGVPAGPQLQVVPGAAQQYLAVRPGPANGAVPQAETGSIVPPQTGSPTHE